MVDNATRYTLAPDVAEELVARGVLQRESDRTLVLALASGAD